MKLTKIQKEIIFQAIEEVASHKNRWSCNAILHFEREVNPSNFFEREICTLYNEFFTDEFEIDCEEVEKGLSVKRYTTRRVLMLSLFLEANS